jgi:hypothetical protein
MGSILTLTYIVIDLKTQIGEYVLYLSDHINGVLWMISFLPQCYKKFRKGDGAQVPGLGILGLILCVVQVTPNSLS